jgi:hypothetical protein
MRGPRRDRRQEDDVRPLKPESIRASPRRQFLELWRRPAVGDRRVPVETGSSGFSCGPLKKAPGDRVLAFRRPCYVRSAPRPEMLRDVTGEPESCGVPRSDPELETKADRRASRRGGRPDRLVARRKPVPSDPATLSVPELIGCCSIFSGTSKRAAAIRFAHAMRRSSRSVRSSIMRACVTSNSCRPSRAASARATTRSMSEESGSPSGAERKAGVRASETVFRIRASRVPGSRPLTSSRRFLRRVELRLSASSRVTPAPPHLQCRAPARTPLGGG